MSIDRSCGDTQQPGRHVLVAASVVKRDVDRLSLQLAEWRAYLKSERMPRFRERRNTLRQNGERYLRAVRENHRAFDGVLQFPDVPRPVVAGQRKHGFFRESVD